jgi:hypothetical protein
VKVIHVHTDSTGSSSRPDTTVFAYNSANAVLTIVNGSMRDTLAYSAGVLTTRTSSTAGSTTPDVTYSYQYSGGQLTAVVESRPGNPDLTTTLTYSGGNLTSVVPSSFGNSPALRNITWSGGDVAEADVDFAGQGAASTVHVTVTHDTHPHDRSVVPTSGGDFVEYFSAHNILTATATTALPLAGIKVGDKILDRMLTYTSTGSIATRTEMPSVSNNQTTDVTTFSYDCK